MATTDLTGAPDTPNSERDVTAALANPRFCGDSQLAAVLAGGTLARGARGDGVKRVQQAMSDMGFALPNTADGGYGAQTEKAVRNFQVNASQMSSDVKVTGTFDAATLRALDQCAPAPGALGQAKNVPLPFFEGRQVRVVVLKNEHRTFLFDAQGKLERVFINAVGAKATATDEGLKTVRSRLDEHEALKLGETLYHGPVFGPRILNLSWADGRSSDEELHGTSAPAQLGEDVSHGCVRHDNRDIIVLYDALRAGALVAIAAGLTDARLRR